MVHLLPARVSKALLLPRVGSPASRSRLTTASCSKGSNGHSICLAM
jgi:hypothetical protein